MSQFEFVFGVLVALMVFLAFMIVLFAICVCDERTRDAVQSIFKALIEAVNKMKW